MASVAIAQSAPSAEAPAVRLPADAATRAAYDRADALSRSVFWSNEHTLNPMDPVAGVKMAQALRELGQYDRAAETAEGVLTTQPRNIEAMLEIGRAHIARGQAFYGIQALERARDEAPRDWRPLSLLGVAYQQVRRPEDANAAWNAALAISPNQPEILSNIAIACMGAGNLAEAEHYLRRAAAQPTASLQVRQNLALALGLQGKTAEAEAILRRDAPPEVVDQNLAWLAQRTQEMRGVTASPAPEAAPASTTTRSWESLNR
ncbi:tetratricopeptide repeat protein [Brevundimonas pishanensis]|uniref:tetratricopeptide repeat protein n=1 Tax=Brevundimonas pishanensis TaxID=2896315 RepID=UPI001FA7FCF9|nr:tetratricopeptide repeat protein [Brevundimonas pishanensis]